MLQERLIRTATHSKKVGRHLKESHVISELPTCQIQLDLLPIPEIRPLLYQYGTPGRKLYTMLGMYRLTGAILNPNAATWHVQILQHLDFEKKGSRLALLKDRTSGPS
jgi:hypothetical protein